MYHSVIIKQVLMKYLWVFCLATLSISSSALSQDYKSFKVGLGLGYALLNDGTGAGILTLEPAYRTSDDFAIGLRIEAGATGYYEGKSFGSYTANLQYYFNEDTFRPFIGSGLGLYQFGNGDNGARFGFYPRVGFDLEHFTMSFDFNILPVTSDAIYNDLSSYIHLRIGMCIGGGKRD
jgi:hypothetical protein